MHSMFSATLLTDAGKKYVREHELDFDAQSVYEKLSTYYTNSTSARMNASDILSHITSAKIDAWKGNSESFIINWQDQIQIYESLIDSNSHFSENQKKILLENSTASTPALRAVKDQADQHKT